MINGLPDRLRESRERCSLSQREVARRMEVSPSLISGYETGERTPSAEMLLALAGLYSCGTDYLLGIKAAAPGASVLSGLTAAQVSIIRAIADEFRKTNG